MRSRLKLVVVLAALLPATAAVKADIDATAPPPKASNLQLVIMEAPGCTYCGIFRRDVLPSYEASERGKVLPVRFLDVNDAGASDLDLQSPVDIVPTFIVVKDKKEVGRIPGYVGPENFYHGINHLMSTAP
jgi:thioredoxin-related protein